MVCLALCSAEEQHLKGLAPSAQLLLCWAVCGHCLPSAQWCSQARVVFEEAEGGFGKSADCSVHF